MDADAIVIGAGAAGLAAARSLAGRSLRVILPAARDRVGGRVWSHPSARAEVATELGAEFIHGPAEVYILRVTYLARQLTQYNPDTQDWAWYTAFPFVGYASILSGAIMMFVLPADALFVLAAGVLLPCLHRYPQRVGYCDVHCGSSRRRGTTQLAL